MAKPVFVSGVLAIAVVWIYGSDVIRADPTSDAVLWRCMNATGVPYDFRGAKTIPKTKAGECFVGCVYQRRGIVSDGKYSIEGALNFMGIEYSPASPEMAKAKTIAKTCGDKLAMITGVCELGFKIAQCEVPLMKAAGLQLSFRKDLV